jgi:hypothetical protein
MIRIIKRASFALLLSALFVTCARSQTTVAPASCNQSDVNAVINWPTHPTTHGDTINISCESRMWTAGITVQSGAYISILGVVQEREHH